VGGRQSFKSTPPKKLTTARLPPNFTTLHPSQQRISFNFVSVISKMSNPRKRRPFKPPTDSDSDSSLPAYIDDQEQDTLISTLRATDTSTTAFYQRLFLLVPLAALLPYFFPHFFPTTNPQATLPTHSWWSVNVPCVTSILVSAYMLVRLPLPGAQLGWADWVGIVRNAGDSPIARVGPFNALLVVVVSLRGYVLYARGQGSWLLGMLPLCKFGTRA
jgi:hypothetical protein